MTTQHVDVEEEVSFKSNGSAEATEIQERIAELVEGRDWHSREVFGVRLALEEAIVNAMKHGNGGDPSMSVHVRFKLTDSELCIRVTDEGTGFDLSDVADPTLPENLGKPCGRGIMLMRQFMTSIKYNDAGNQVTLVLRRSVDAGDDTDRSHSLPISGAEDDSVVDGSSDTRVELRAHAA